MENYFIVIDEGKVLKKKIQIKFLIDFIVIDLKNLENILV